MKTTNYFDFSATWLNGSDDVAEISIRLGERIISRIADTDKQTVRDSFRASSTGLALWIADNWWRLRWETMPDSRFPSIDWRLCHEMNSASGGALWPPVMIFSAGDRIAFAPSVGKKFIDGPQSYFDFKIGVVSANEYESELDVFFSSVLENCARTTDGLALNKLLQQINVEREDDELSAWRRLEACLGFNPDLAPDEVIDALVAMEDIAGEDGVEEAAHARPGVESAGVLKLAIDATKESAVQVDLSLADKVIFDQDLPSHATPWQMAEKAAAHLRQLIGVPKGVLKQASLEEIFKARWSDLKEATATARQLPYGARVRSSDSKAHLALQTFRSYDRRFELVRQFGDAIWQKDSGFGVISRAKTDRQKFQRAFAHSLLCPFNDLQYVLDVNSPTLEAMERAARHFKVNPSVVRNQLIYKGYLPFENSSEEAEAV